LILTFAKVPPRRDANVRIGPLATRYGQQTSPARKLPIDNIPTIGLYTCHPAPLRGVCTASSDAGRGAVAGKGALEMRRKFPSPAVQAAPSRAARRSTTDPAGGGPAKPEHGRFVGGHSGGLGVGAQKAQPLKGTSTGGGTEQTSNIARGTPGTWRTCGTKNPSKRLQRGEGRQASMSRGVEVRGSVGPPGVPRALFFFTRRARSDDGLPGAAQEYGR
jgi:hypothetical protein